MLVQGIPSVGAALANGRLVSYVSCSLAFHSALLETRHGLHLSSVTVSLASEGSELPSCIHMSRMIWPNDQTTD